MTTYTYNIVSDPNGYRTIVTSINDAGQVVGYYFDATGAYGFIDTNGNFITLDMPASDFIVADPTGRGLAINASGDVAGTYESNNSSGQVGFIETNGNFTTISAPGASSTTAVAINASDQVAGNYYDGTGGHGFIYTNGSFTTLNGPGASSTTAEAINASGQVAGYYYDGTSDHGFIYTNGNFTTLDAPGSSDTIAFAINDSGQAVGYFQDGTGGHGFIETNGVFTTLDPLGASFTTALAINDSGQVAGYYYDGTLHGFIETNGVFTKIDVPGANSTQISSINDSGQVVGFYSDGTGGHSFIASLAGPVVTSISATTDNGAVILDAGHVVTITVDTSEDVTVTGSPLLQLNNNEVATYAGGSGSESLNFTYVIKSGDDISDLQVTDLHLNGGSIADSSGNLITGAVHADLALVVDTVTPTVSSIVNSQGTFQAGSAVAVTFDMSEGVTVANGTPTLSLNDGGTATYDAAHSTATALVFDYAVGAHDTATSALAITAVNLGGAIIQDAAGNLANLSGGQATLAGAYINIAINGNDTVNTGANSTVTLGNGNDMVTGGAASMITVGNGNDTVNAGAGSIITAGNGNDTLTGGDNSTVNAGQGNDTMSIGSSSTLKAGNGNDSVTASSNDAITLGNGNDTITAGANSTIMAGNGNDTIHVGMGDTVTVGHGNDTFVFDQVAANMVGNVTLTGFNPSHDVIDITSALATFLGLAGTQTQMDSALAALFHDTGAGGAAQIHLDATDTITLTNVHTVALHATDFHIV